MRHGALRVLLVSALAASIGACDEYATRPVNRGPIITSVVAFPTVLDLGDSALVTVFATDPDGDTLVYDWDGYNGLVTTDGTNERSSIYHTSNRSRVFYLRWRPAGYDTAFIWCGVRDVKGGGHSQQVLFVLRDSSGVAQGEVGAGRWHEPWQQRASPRGRRQKGITGYE